MSEQSQQPSRPQPKTKEERVRWLEENWPDAMATPSQIRAAEQKLVEFDPEWADSIDKSHSKMGARLLSRKE